MQPRTLKSIQQQTSPHRIRGSGHADSSGGSDPPDLQPKPAGATALCFWKPEADAATSPTWTRSQALDSLHTRRAIFSVSLFTTSAASTNMTDDKVPLEPPPSYESAAEHTTGAKSLPIRPGGPKAPLPLDLPALNKLRGGRVILASASPRRQQLLAQASLYPSVDAHTLTDALSDWPH